VRFFVVAPFASFRLPRARDPHLALNTQLHPRAAGSSYEKRKHAALEIENIIKALNQLPDNATPSREDRIRGVIAILQNDYARSTQANQRKGGLIGLAACAIALQDDVCEFLLLLLSPILKCFSDQESRVRYYATESLYNMAKVCVCAALVFVLCVCVATIIVVGTGGGPG
jgi:hypothetical protein